MITGEAYAVSAAAVADARAFLRIDGAGQDDTLESLIAAGLEACEAYTGMPPVVRAYRQRFAMRSAWTVLGAYPVRAIASVSAVEDGVAGAALAGAAYEADIDACDRGRVRVIVPPGAPGVEVAFSAGLAADWSACPGSLRFGVLHWVGEAMAAREGGALPPSLDRLGTNGLRDGPPSRAGKDLWRPYRAVRL